MAKIIQVPFGWFCMLQLHFHRALLIGIPPLTISSISFMCPNNSCAYLGPQNSETLNKCFHVFWCIFGVHKIGWTMLWYMDCYVIIITWRIIVYRIIIWYLCIMVWMNQHIYLMHHDGMRLKMLTSILLFARTPENAQ